MALQTFSVDGSGNERWVYVSLRIKKTQTKKLYGYNSNKWRRPIYNTFPVKPLLQVI